MQRGEKLNHKAIERPTTRVEPSSGNVFADLGIPDAAEHLAKARLVQQLDSLLAERKLDHAHAANLLGIGQPEVSAILSGQFKGYSADQLMGFLSALGQGVENVVRPRRREGSSGSVRVRSLQT